jgi:hydrogenase nickel incorporation protein HypA/HybF
MHEMGIAIEIAKIAREEAEKNSAIKVTLLALKVGRWSGVEPETLRFALGAVCEETILEGCKIEIEITEPTFNCEDCGNTFIAEGHFDPCPHCGSAGGPLICGDELTITHLEVDDS